ncbi:Protein EFR3 homolog [Caenorhabditis elegans]|uniref:Protein EFR3 homolog n=1 Tax=Caenorhabditis elegans TaxID=6239 RepID=EFR3_CAEEL|nr:Protein EFR3 homolog [Caenorhabditis elegans]Q09263.1 RecName: Full=Protein EFR3 homolog [Caenorhabditis elegans]CCD66029.1 Protein EFR3 homolog [Caenorhabditis elegans]|eukprot:NP_495269.1 Protein EFR3 homolog [Caenorhabditis elegans]
MNGLCCCTPCKPRYRRLVDSIYPRAVTDGLLYSNMQKLTFYAISHPEKLERIGEYLVMRMVRDLSRQRPVQVKIAVEAMDQLLQACHSSPSLPQFSENHLRMVQRLLESNNAKMEQLATDSFVTFSNIEESSPSYHRQYDFFIDKFSQMCHANPQAAYGDDFRLARCAGLRGLRGVVWKSVTDDLHPNIWEQQHMDKIVPSILFNLQEPDDSGKGFSSSQIPKFDNTFADSTQSHRVDDEATPKVLSDRCLRELMGKASFGSLRAVIEPVLKHMDLHKRWTPPPSFAIHVFRAIIYSIQSQNSYFVIQELINHLDSMCSADASTRIGIATVLSSIVSIAGTSIGPLLLSIFNSLLKHLRTSVDFERSGKCSDQPAEKMYQEALINAMGDFANALPDYQKVEMMMFTVGNIPNLDERKSKQGDEFLQHVLVKTLLKVATKYRTAYLATVFTDSFLDTLLLLALVRDPQVRLATQQIFHTLLDRHDNAANLVHLGYELDVSDVQLTVEKCSRADQMFMRKHIGEITYMLLRAVALADENDLNKHIDAVLCTMSLLCIESLIELFRLSLALQQLALDSKQNFSDAKRNCIHNMVAKYLNLSAQLIANPSLCQQVQHVVSCRAQRGIPGLNLLLNVKDSPNNDDPLSSSALNSTSQGATTITEEDQTLLFNAEDIAESLKASGKDATRLFVPFNFNMNGRKNDGSGDQWQNDTPNFDSTDGRESPSGYKTVGIDDVSVDMSVDWTPPVSRKQSRRNTIFSIVNPPKLNASTVDDLKAYANATFDPIEEGRKEKELTGSILSEIRNTDFEERVNTNESLNEKSDLSKSIARLLVRNGEMTRVRDIGRPAKPKNLFEIELPSFAY